MSDHSKRVGHWLVDQPAQPRGALLLAHGAGAGMEHPFMSAMAHSLCQQSLLVVRFNFEYMALIAATGKRRPPSKMPVLVAEFQHQLEAAASHWPGLSWFIGGKSMGGRVASMALNNCQAEAGVCIGYPFHPPKKYSDTRLQPLQDAEKAILIIQGTRDALGNQEEVSGYKLAASTQLLWLEDGDHDLKPRKKSGFSQQQHIVSAAQAIAQFCLA